MRKIVRAADVVCPGLADAIPPLSIEIESEDVKFKIIVKEGISTKVPVTSVPLIRIFVGMAEAIPISYVITYVPEAEGVKTVLPALAVQPLEAIYVFSKTIGPLNWFAVV